MLQILEALKAGSETAVAMEGSSVGCFTSFDCSVWLL